MEFRHYHAAAGESKSDGRWRVPACTPPNAQQLLARYAGLDQFSYPIHTRSHEAQKLFDLVGHHSTVH